MYNSDWNTVNFSLSSFFSLCVSGEVSANSITTRANRNVREWAVTDGGTSWGVAGCGKQKSGWDLFRGTLAGSVFSYSHWSVCGFIFPHKEYCFILNVQVCCFNKKCLRETGHLRVHMCQWHWHIVSEVQSSTMKLLVNSADEFTCRLTRPLSGKIIGLSVFYRQSENSIFL